MITEVEMINWRAFERRKFTFKPGLNFIMGPNGKGKTSILEAISYGLTGEPSVVNDRDELLRDPEKPATVKLTFKVNEKVYLIERTQQPGRAGEAHLVDVQSKKSLAYSHKGVTEKVEKLTGVSADFLRRIIYMAEGDVFRFLKDPPGKAMNQQVQEVLGLTQLDQFQEGIKLAQKNLREQSKAFKVLRQRIADLQITPEQTLDGMVEYLDNQRKRLMDQILIFQDELTRFQERNIALLALNKYIEEHLVNLQSNKEYWEKSQNISLESYYEELNRESNLRTEKIKEWNKDLARFGGQMDAYDRIFRLIPDPHVQDNVPCPVCKKPMTVEERQLAYKDAKSEVDKLEADLRLLGEKLKQIESEGQDARKFMGILQEIWNNIIHNQYKVLSTNMSLPQVIDTLRAMKDQSKQSELNTNITAVRKSVDELERARANFVSVQNQLGEQKFSNPEDVRDALVQIETRLLTLNAASQAAENTLADMRDVNIAAIYNQITAVWNNFIQRGQWHLRFDADGSPLLEEESEREFGFSQFSGGEKTALLVIIHTVIAHHFSNCKFLLVDEPLEHLDPVNRRSLMRFFMAACQNHFFEQALISTYEESLVRKYISDENVNIIHIN